MIEEEKAHPDLYDESYHVDSMLLPTKRKKIHLVHDENIAFGPILSVPFLIKSKMEKHLKILKILMENFNESYLNY